MDARGGRGPAEFRAVLPHPGGDGRVSTPLYQLKAEFFKTLGHPARIRVLELLSERDHAACLHSIRAQLAEDGAALIPLFVPPPTPAEQIGRVRTVTAADGAELRVSA